MVAGKATRASDQPGDPMTQGAFHQCGKHHSESAGVDEVRSSSTAGAILHFTANAIIY